MIDTTHRSTQEEIMDDFDMANDTLIGALDKLELVNKWLGGNGVTLSGLEMLLRDHPKDQEVIIADLGCGHGDLMRKIAEWGRKKGYTLRIVGYDANPHTIQYGRELSDNYPEMEYKVMNILSDEFQQEQFDIVNMTLFLHHFSDAEIDSLMNLLSKMASKGIVINDLHRSKIAYFLFNIITLFVGNEMVRHDGLVSILRSFKRKELEHIARKTEHNFNIDWQWAFRFRCVIDTK